MKTCTSSRSRVIAAWLVLLAFMCCMMVPSSAIAIQEMTIATEGDPTDGFGASGGGSGYFIDDGDQTAGVFPDRIEDSVISNRIFQVRIWNWVPIIVFNGYEYFGQEIFLNRDLIFLQLGEAH